MRVLFYLGEFPLLSQTFVLDQITGLIERGVDVAILAERPQEPAPIHSSVRDFQLAERTRYFPDHSEGHLTAIPGFLRSMVRDRRFLLLGVLRSLGADCTGARGISPLARANAARGACPVDVILAHFGPNGLRALSLREYGVTHAPIATVFHGYDVSVWPRQRGSQRYRPLFERAELMLPVTALFRDRLIEFGCPAEKVQVHRMGVDVEAIPFHPREPKQEHEPFELLSIGRFVEKKGFEYALLALSFLARAGARFCYHVVGDGPLRKELFQLCRDLGLSDQVVFHGSLRRDQVVGLLNRADIMLVPSVTAANGDQEGLPVALMEAMAAGLPVVASRHSGIAELVHHESTGLLVPERDAPALASALGRLTGNAAFRGQLADRARRLVGEQHALRILNDQLVARLRRLAAL